MALAVGGRERIAAAIDAALEGRIRSAPRGRAGCDARRVHEVTWAAMRTPGLLSLLSAALLLSSAAACGGDDDRGGTDAGGVEDAGPAEDGGGPPACDAPDTACPDEPPISGAPCEGDLTCEYDGDANMYSCDGGEWDVLSCPGCAPPLSERCRDPFDGTLDGVSVEIGPSGDAPFAPFSDGDRIMPTFGGQGSAMVAYRVRLSDDSAPACLTVTANVSLDEEAASPFVAPIRFRCGETLQVFVILPFNPCDPRDYDVRLDVEVEGVGIAGVDLVLEGGMCPLGP